MRIRAVEVQNWACIESLELTGLADGVVVLHGPNRLGKSSLVQAIRSAVFDHLHDSQEKTIQAAIPLKTKATPQVTVELEHAGQRYRITKTFARTKEGRSVLEQQNGAGWTVLIKGKEASKKLREIVGAASSNAGIFQLLWLGQRDFLLPAPTEVDSDLQKALEKVLGNLITGRDIEFRKRLDRECERWFTEKNLQLKKGCRVSLLAEELAEARERQKEIAGQWRNAESELNQYNEGLAQAPELKSSLEAAENELAQVATQCEEVRSRQNSYKLAVQSRDQCQLLLESAQKKVAEFEEAQRKHEEMTRKLAEHRAQSAAAEEARDQAQTALDACLAALKLAEERLAEHQRSRDELDDRQRLIGIQEKIQQLTQQIERAAELESERTKIEARLAGPPVLSVEETNRLRGVRDRIREIRAQLRAEEIQITITPSRDLTAELSRDGEAAEAVTLPTGIAQEWPVQQSATIRLGDVASIQVRRGSDGKGIAALREEMQKLDSEYKQALTTAQLDPDDLSCLDRVAERRANQQHDTKQLKGVREQLAQVAPRGLPALHADVRAKEDERAAILARRPALADWTPDQAELEGLRAAFTRTESEWKRTVSDASAECGRIGQRLESAKTTHQNLHNVIAVMAVEQETAARRIEGVDRTSLDGEVENAKASLQDASRRVLECTLTPEEQSLEERHEGVRHARDQRAKRLRATELLLEGLRTKLAGTEGLHQKRTQADQAVEELTAAHAREDLHAQAHKHLKELFERVHQEEMSRTVGPINDRVMQWARQLGVTDYLSLDFGDHLLPAGLVTGVADNGKLALERESYGTVEQLSLLIRLAVGSLLAHDEPAVAIFDDPLAHADAHKHRRMLDIFARAVRGEPSGPHPTGPLQILILTCHPERFDYLEGSQQIDLTQCIRRGG